MLFKVGRQHLLGRYLSSVMYTPPNISDLPRKWATMNPSLKEEIIEYIGWKMEDSWTTLPLNEVKASYYISYGEWGPRSSAGGGQVDPTYFIWKGLFSSTLFLALGVSLFNMRKDKKVDEHLKLLENKAS